MTDHLQALPAEYQLNEYRIEGVIGSGGFGITYLARDIQLDKTVAIKEYLPSDFAVRTDTTTVRPKSTADQDDYQWGLKRFQDEARTLARFEHPHLNHVHRHFEGNGTAYLVLDYIEGETLSDLLKREGRLESTHLQRLVTELLSGLDEVHSAGYVHRDVKPSNIMLRKNGSSVLLDFGAARQVLGQRSKSITSVLTPGYAPIEQYDQKGDDIGPWTDLYALGMVAYRCVSGISETKLLDAITRARLERKGKQDQDMVPAVEVGKGHYPLPLLKAIDWAIKVEENERPQNVAAIQEMIAGDEASDAVPDAVPVDKPTKQPMSPKSEQSRGWVLVWVVVVLVLVGFLSWSPSVEHERTVEREPVIRTERPNQVEREQRAEAERAAQAERERRAEAERAAQAERERRAEAERAAQAERERRAEAERAAQAERERRATAQKCQSYYNNQRYAGALDSCLRAAAHGDVSAQNNLGYMYWTGQGVAHDYIEAFKWYSKAAEQGLAIAQRHLGTMYRNGYGVTQDYAEAAKWYRKSAEQGNAQGQFYLGIMYSKGKGVLQDYTEAVKWYRKAAEQGNASGQYNLGAMYYNGKGVAWDDTEADKWFRKAAEQGNAEAQYTLGEIYSKGGGDLSRNTRKAREWYRKAAAQGHAGAQKALRKL